MLYLLDWSMTHNNLLQIYVQNSSHFQFAEFFTCEGILLNMSDSQFGANSHVLKLVRRHRLDWLTLLLLGLIDGLLNLIEPFHRYLSEEMLTPDIKYPYHHDTIPMWSVPVRSPSHYYHSCYNSFKLNNSL